MEAITLRNMSYPHWLGLLKWSLGHSDGTSESKFKEMSGEDKEWLEKVMAEMVRDEPKRLSEILKIFSEILDRGVTDTDESDIEGMLEEVQGIIDQIDMADIFVRFGGIKALLGFLHSPNLSDALKKLVCVIFGDLAQNNPPVQEAFLRHGVLDDLCVLAITHPHPEVCGKVMYAISCSIRGYPPGETRFCCELSGPVLLVRLLGRCETICTRRVYFLATALLMSDSCPSQRIASIAESLLPFALSSLYDVDMETRDNALHFVSAVSFHRAGRVVLKQLGRTVTTTATTTAATTANQQEVDSTSHPSMEIGHMSDEEGEGMGLGGVVDALRRRECVVRRDVNAYTAKCVEDGEDRETAVALGEEMLEEEGRRIRALWQQLRRGMDEDEVAEREGGEREGGGGDSGGDEGGEVSGKGAEEGEEAVLMISGGL